MTVISGRKCCESYGRHARLGSLAKMLLESSIWHSRTYVLRWKIRAMKSNRLLFQLAPSKLSLDKILYGSEINSLRDILRPAFCYEFVPCSISCGFGLACSLGWFALVGPC
jgi:hypothetical protein